jgi:hypothetical protein
MAASRFVEVTNKEISEIKINSVPKKPTKDVCKTRDVCEAKLVLGDYQDVCEPGRSSCSAIIGDFVSVNIPR